MGWSIVHISPRSNETSQGTLAGECFGQVTLKVLRSPPDSPHQGPERHKEQSWHQGIGRARL